MISNPRKNNAILLNIKINRPKLASMCGYKLATNWQNFTEIYLAGVKLLQKVLGYFLTHTGLFFSLSGSGHSPGHLLNLWLNPTWIWANSPVHNARRQMPHGQNASRKIQDKMPSWQNAPVRPDKTVHSSLEENRHTENRSMMSTTGVYIKKNYRRNDGCLHTLFSKVF